MGKSLQQTENDLVTSFGGTPWWYKRSKGERYLVLVTSVALCLVIVLVIALAGVIYSSQHALTYDQVTLVTRVTLVRMGKGQVCHFIVIFALVDHPLLVSLPISLQIPKTARKLFSDMESSDSLPASNEVGQPPVTNGSRKKYNVCHSKGCVLAGTSPDLFLLHRNGTAAEILNNMDPREEPCNDFYRFACGGFVDKTIIPDDKTSVNQFSKIADQLKENLRLLVEEPIRETEPPPFVMLKNVYASCMNKTQVNALGLHALKEVLNDLGGWPVVRGADWNETSFSWNGLIYKYRNMGFSIDYFIDFSVVTDIKNSSWRILDVCVDDDDVQAYYHYMVKIAVLLGAEPERARKELREALEFEILLSNYSLPDEERRNATKLYNKMTIGELEKKWPSIPWLEYVNEMLTPFHHVTVEEPVIIDVPEYIKKLAGALQVTPKRVMANYAIWRIVAASAAFLTEDAREIQLEFSSKLTGQSERQPRWKECMGIVLSSFANALGAMYVRRFFREDAKNSALEMVKDIRAEFDAILDEVDWMDEKTRALAKQKSAKIQSHIAYPEELLNDGKLAELYEGLNTTSDYYYRNMLNMTLFGTNYSFRRLRELVDKNDWVAHGRAAVVNAFYSPLENSIQFPAGILQGAFFGADRPRYLNYGGIGFVIGHEITHGFDDQVNGELTVGENIADNGGLKQAYRGYLRWVERERHRQGEEEVEPCLPGLLDFSPRQMFWISAANVWCSKYRPEQQRLQVYSDPHAPAMFRIKGPFSNLPDFARDFKCRKGTNLNPSFKCEVW
ncbi:unnamed protein product [Darwinula stevensoni]|uniref:Membrane metallo-endopeptidase-like 1 n=1 Tax=Darwinula stevensoni TaxID=69355 RepID=A0A7R8XFF3_9CRUS|nr:unnamed protein product [Darwinula stevensoni]CAG0895469.1 unnamed protein product [Darwinula stevensoni]